MKRNLRKILSAVTALTLTAAALPLSSCGSSSSGGKSGKKFEGQTLVVCSWGGAIQDAQRKTIFEPFMEETGCIIEEATEPDPAKIKSMVESGNMEIDVWDVDTDFVPRGIAQDLFEKLDFDGANIQTKGMNEAYVTDYSVPCETSTLCISWNSDDYSQDNHPTTWADFFDTEKYPGKRTLYTNPMSMFESILLADGVAPEDMYPLDVDRAFNFLDKHKDDILKFWESGAESVELVAGGECSLGGVWGGRAITAKADGQKIDYEPNQAILASDSFVIGKGSQNQELANAFIAYATSPEVVANYATEYPGNAPCTTEAYQYMSDDAVKALASNPDTSSSQLFIDVDWWYENYDKVYERFQEWKIS